MASVVGRHCAREECGELFVVSKTSKQKYCSSKCRALGWGLEWSDRANTVRVWDGTYYILLIPEHPNADNRGYVREHVWVMSLKLGRPIAPGEDVHHKDENKRNNSDDNLEVLTHSGHAREHAGWVFESGTWWKPCGRCGERFPASTEHFSPRDAEGNLNNECRPCAATTRREYRKAQREREDADDTVGATEEGGRGPDAPEGGDLPGGAQEVGDRETG